MSSTLTIPTALSMPLCGLGTWLATLPQDTEKALNELERAVEYALEAGVRLFDMAFLYRNEKVIGKVLNRWIESGRLKRSDLFIVTKLPLFGNRASSVQRYMDYSLENLGMDYVDLYLIHTPVSMKEKKDLEDNFNMLGGVEYEPTDFVSVWGAMEEQVYAGKARSIGVSNFSTSQLRTIQKVAKIPIAVNQVELHLYFQQKKLRETMDQLGVRTMAYGSFGSTGQAFTASPKVLEDPTVAKLATKYKKSAGQILLRHLMQHDIIVIPKSLNQKRIQANFDVFDFELSEDDMKTLDSLDQGSKARGFTFQEILSDDVKFNEDGYWE